MSQPRAPSAAPDRPREAPRRPRLAIMGEFSAGKSTLTNLLLGEAALPTRVTATQLPPVWIGRGTAAPHGVDLEGRNFPVDLVAPDAIDLATTRYVRVERMAELLDACDLIDLPGISDPNMPPETWERVMPLVDGVIWCTHATQAWRQSEAAFWEAMPEQARRHAVLLLTRIDKIAEPRDRKRVRARVAAETDGAFADICPVSLTQAGAEDDGTRAESGFEPAMAAIHGLVAILSQALGRDLPQALQDRAASLTPEDVPDTPDAESDGRVVPRRVRRRGAARAARLSAAEAAEVTAHIGPG